MLSDVSSGRRFKKSYLIVSLFLYYGLIFALSHIPGKTIADLGFNIWDKAAHMIVYFPLGVLVGVFALKFKKFLFPPVFFLFGVTLVLVFGAMDEFHQSYVQGRYATVSDIVADVIGGGGGLAAVLLFRLRRSRTL